MGIIGNIIARFTTDTSQWSKGCDTAAKDVGKVDKGYKGFLESLKGGFGRGSSVEETMKLLRGGGALLGLREGAKAAKELAEGAAKVSEQLRNGEGNADDMVASLARGVPIFGDLFSAAESLREAYSGDKAAIDAAAASSAKMVTDIEHAAKHAEQFKAALDSIGASAETAKRATAIINSTDDQAKQLQADYAHLDAIKKINEEAKKAQKANKSDALDGLRADFAKLNDERSKNMALVDYDKNNDTGSLNDSITASLAQKELDASQEEYDTLKAQIAAAQKATAAEGEKIDKASNAAKLAEDGRFYAEKAKLAKQWLEKDGKAQLTPFLKAFDITSFAKTFSGSASAVADKHLKELQKDAEQERKDNETPFDKYTESVKNYDDQLKHGIITQAEFNKFQLKAKQEETEAEAALAKKKPDKPDFQQNTSEARRFTFGRVDAPKAGSPLTDMAKLAKDAATKRERIAKAVEATNTILANAAKNWGPATVISGGGW